MSYADVSYVIPGLLVIVLVMGFVVFLALNARSKDPAGRSGDGAPGMGPDSAPLGDTVEHSDSEGDPQAPGRPATVPQGRFQRDPVGGEAEGRAALAPEDR